MENAIDKVSDSVAGNGKSETNNYEAVRCNALKHGVLSKHVVLPREDSAEFGDIHYYEIKTQTLGEGFEDDRLEKLSRYETHLDRKFERTLAMLVKLKELRVKE